MGPASPCLPERHAAPRNASVTTWRPCTAEAEPQAERAVTSRDCTPVNFEEPDKDFASLYSRRRDRGTKLWEWIIWRSISNKTSIFWAAAIAVVPSMWQDTCPTVALEASAAERAVQADH
jgi:anti-sigma-K factor RskA